jgi:DNA-binding transcriptional LysR family regulator
MLWRHELDRLQALRLFTRAVELGSFSAVAREARVSQPTVSKVIAALERDIGVRLIERTTTSLSITNEGRRFYQRCRQLADDYADAVAEVRGQAQQMIGKLTVSGPLGLGEFRLNALVVEFLSRHSGIEVELILNDRMVDLVEEGIDVAVRLGGPLPPDAVAREIAAAPRILVASPGYLAGAPALRCPDDVERHPYIGYAGLEPRGILTLSNGAQHVSVATSGPYRVNSSLSLRQCFLDGIGIGSAPAWLVQDLVESGDLVRLLPEWTLPSQSVHLLYPTRRYLPRRTQMFLQFMTAAIRALPGFALPDAA